MTHLRGATDSFAECELPGNGAKSQQDEVIDNTIESKRTNISHPPGYDLLDIAQYHVPVAEPSVRQNRHEKARIPTPDMTYASSKVALQMLSRRLEGRREPVRRRRFKFHVRRILSTVPEPAIVRPPLVVKWSPDDPMPFTMTDRPLIRTYTWESDRPLVRPYVAVGSRVYPTNLPLSPIKHLDPDREPLIRRISTTAPMDLVHKTRDLSEELSIMRSRKASPFRGSVKII